MHRVFPASTIRDYFRRLQVLLPFVIAAGNVAANDGFARSSNRIDVLDPHTLALGDGKVSSEPRRGYVYSCQMQFRGGGAQHAGDWIHGSTWDATSKIVVQGSVAWPNATFTIATVDGERRITGNGLPISHTTGVFPVRPSDPAYRIDRNPNATSAYRIAFSLPLTPTLGTVPSCMPMGMIGVALSGVAIFNALDAAGRDAVAHEVQDHCNGHPERHGEYHYHGPTACIPGAMDRNTLIGYALDGFGIYSIYDESGRELTNADLDECHGRVSRILWDGKPVTMYHYVLTREYPYTVGCFRGNALQMQSDRGNQPRDRAQQGPPEYGPLRGPSRTGHSGAPGVVPRHLPPPEAIEACSGLSPGTQCGFISPRGDRITGMCRAPEGALACVPDLP